MRYIKLFEGFNEDKENLRDDISASLVELHDKGFDIQVTISTNNIIVEIRKQESFEDGEFMFDEIEDEIKQLCDYMSEKYSDLEIDYSPETRWTNDSYSSLEEIPEDVIFSDLIAFDLFFTNKSGYFTEKTYENYEQEPDKDGSVNSKGSSKVNRFHFDNGFLSDEEGLRERVRDIFIELEDTSHDVTIDIDKLSISVFIDASDTIVRAGTNYSPINNELNEYSIDYDLTKDCCETFIEYIKDRNPNVDSRLGLNTKYTIEYYDLEKGSGTKEWIREYSEEFPRIELKNKITELKITLSV